MVRGVSVNLLVLFGMVDLIGMLLIWVEMRVELIVSVGVM